MSAFLSPGADALPMNGADIKVAYENQPNTNAFTDIARDNLAAMKTPLDYAADGTAAGDTKAFKDLIANEQFVLLPKRAQKFIVNDEIRIRSDQVIMSMGARVGHEDDQAPIFVADAVEDWAIIGRLFLDGTLTSAATEPEIGLLVRNSRRGLVQGVSTRAFKGHGFLVDGDAAFGSNYGDKTQFDSCSALECTVGAKVNAGAGTEGSGAEYTAWSNFIAAANITGLIVGAGNISMVGGNVTKNTDGIKLLPGFNHGHGTIAAMNINHNGNYNIHALDIAYGFDFADCNIYEQPIVLDRCRMVAFTGGHLDCKVYDRNATGQNFLRGMTCPASYGPVGRYNENSQVPETLIVSDCKGPGARDGNRSINNAQQWVSFHWDGTDIVISGGTDRVTVNRIGEGDYRINWQRNMPDAVYPVSVSVDSNPSAHPWNYTIRGQEAGSIRIAITATDGENVTSALDPRQVTVYLPDVV